jgi:tetratricopeptide (TPR) repeat protein
MQGFFATKRIFALMKELARYFLFAILMPFPVSAQMWASPEVEMMYRQGCDQMARKDYSGAVMNFKHAVAQDRENRLLYNVLGKALFLSGNMPEAEETLYSIHDCKEMDAIAYYMLAESRVVQNKNKEAEQAIKSGIRRFPDSGMLYDEAAAVYGRTSGSADAIKWWREGIANAPSYADNYHHAAKYYAEQGNTVPALICGEIFLCMEHDTTGQDEMKSLLFAGYKKMFSDMAANDVMKYQDKRKDSKMPASFIDDIAAIYGGLAGTIADGIGVESLVMARTRFLIEWFPGNDKKYNSCLFRYQDMLVREGYFDIYNEWLFGRAESATQFESWNKFHEGDIGRFLSWRKEHYLVPGGRDIFPE